MLKLSALKLRRRTVVLLAALAIATACYFHFSIFLGRPITHPLQFSEEGLGFQDYLTRKRMHYTRYDFSLKENFTARHDLAAFAKKPKLQKCMDFFRFMDEVYPQWETSKLEHHVYDKSATRKYNCFQENVKFIVKDKILKNDPKPDEITDEDKAKWNRWFELRVEQLLATENEMADTMSIIRMFGHCFLQDPVAHSLGEAKDVYDRYLRKVTPFFANRLGYFDGPSEVKLFPDAPPFQDTNIVDYYHTNMKGRGIVISGSTKYSRDIVKLIRLLRALNNKLPIQIIYRSDMLIRSKEAVNHAATADIDDLFGPHLSDARLLEKVLPDIDCVKDAAALGITYPKQHVTYINIQPTMLSLSTRDFKGYNNKILALFFNTFEEVLLLDADTVPLILPEDYFQIDEYVKTGAHFFRDRSLKDSNDWIETNYFTKLMPHRHNEIDMALGIKPVTEHTLNNPYLRGWRHSQEAGLIAFDRKRHFTSLLALLPLLMWKEPVRLSIWGDKEMYWLLMLIVGDEDYAFNKYGAASVGTILDKSLMLYNRTKAAEVCLSHPGHVGSDGRLLWLNSGFSYCKKNGYARDQKKFPYSAYGGRDELMRLYEGPLRIENAVVPPDLPPLRPVGSPASIEKETQFVIAAKSRKKDVDDMDVDQIDAYNPQKGWVKSSCCSNYHYCAYTLIESYDNTGELDESGLLFTYTPIERKRYDLLGKVWLTGKKNLLPQKLAEDKEKERQEKEAKEKEAKEKAEKEAKEKAEQEKKEKAEKDKKEKAVQTQENQKADGEKNMHNMRVFDHHGNIVAQPQWFTQIRSEYQSIGEEIAFYDAIEEVGEEFAKQYTLTASRQATPTTST